MISQTLKELTRESHQQLEAVVVRQIKSIRTKEDYLRLLSKFYGYYIPLEQQFESHLNDEIVPQYSQRRKTNLLLNDLRSITDNSETPALASDLPLINSRARAWGSFYVLEGSTQGGDIVAEMLEKYANVSRENVSFFRIYGQEKRNMWLSFIEELNKIPVTEDFQIELVNAATETFSKFKDWMQK